MQRIYLDYNATTPLDPGVMRSMEPFLGEIWGNPSSLHKEGRRARAALDGARERAARVLGAKPSEIVFTSGGTESVNLAILGVARAHRHRGRHLITSCIEHHAVLHAVDQLVRREGFEATLLPVTPEGLVDPASVGAALRPDTVLVSIMAANNEVGTLQPVAAVGQLCRARGVLFHTDAVQFFGKVPFGSVRDLEADLLSLCGHKFHGPKGAGLLYVRSTVELEPLLFGGPHENERRAGTENLAAIAGLVDAMERFLKPPVFDPVRTRALGDMLLQGLLTVPGVVPLGSRAHALGNTVAVAVHGVDSATLLAALDVRGVSASAGSACSSGALEPSHVALALGIPRELASGLIRFSLGRETTETDVRTTVEIFQEAVEVARQCGQPANAV
ncbi:MAG: cysteine desulfurase family protein [Verrucomicrobiota bacterium]|nr:cysteine desulfurase [Limisphaera sp.]MDW8382585.1 cysteine desulfurase family protein [Verrucomicrobiota bacterium]